MRRRLFWTIGGVAVVTGFLVLLGSVVATQRAAIDATRRELERSSQEVLAAIDQAADLTAQNPRAILDLFRVLEGERMGPLLGQIRRSAGSSELAFAAITPDGQVRAGAGIFDRIELDEERLEAGEQLFLTSTDDELVLVSPTEVLVGQVEATLLVALARDTPVVRIADVGRGFILVAAGILVVAAVLARVLSRQLSSRLQPLADASRQVASGDATVRVPDLGDPELNEVATAFNEMAGELEATRARERDFILGVGHDLRTPLTTIGGYAEALEAGELEPDDMERIGGVLGRQSHQMSRLIEDLTLLARLEQPEFGLRIEPVDIGAHVGEIAEGFRQTADSAGVALEIDVAEGLVAETDPERLGQITQNLVENSLRYTPEAGRVSVRVAAADEAVVISVEDSGVGIDPEDLPHIFDRHFVGRRRQVRREGSGLGLSIVKGLADRLGATVEVDASPGRGTTVRVSFSTGLNLEA